MTMMTEQTAPLALVLGASGGIGSAVAAALVKQGWRVRAMARKPRKAARTPGLTGVDWVRGDAMRSADVMRAAEGAEVIFHGVNPPGYRNWQGRVLPMLESTIAAARAHKARIVFPGTVYNYGPDAGAVVAEDAPQNPVTRKGKLRVQMENRLHQASVEGIPVLIVRAGDFIGGTVANNWFAQGVVTPGKPLHKITYPGRPEVGHAWAYLPDLAETFVQLIARREELPLFARFHFSGYWFENGIDLAHATQAAAGDDTLPIRRFPWWLIRALSPVVETFREMQEMRYLWQRPLRLDNAKLVAFLGEEPHTPVVTGLRQVLEELDCVPADETLPRAARIPAAE